MVYADSTPKSNFFVTRIGHAEGHSDESIGPQFARAPGNCSLPDVWKQFIFDKQVAAAERHNVMT